VFFTKEGHAIHGTYEVKRLGKPASHGCVRLSTENAATLYALVLEEHASGFGGTDPRRRVQRRPTNEFTPLP
jgi:L,D-transpeptidase catalytic domain